MELLPCRPRPRISRSFLFAGVALLPALGCLCPATLFAQTVTFTDTTAVNFGNVNLCATSQTAPCSETLTLNYKVTGSGTLGTPRVLTMGVPDLDFTLASDSTCVGTVSAPGTCTANVTFKPTQPGNRNGAIQLTAADGKVLATTFLRGNSLGPQIGLDPSLAIAEMLLRGQSPSAALAIDDAEDVFVLIGSNVVEIKPDGTTITLPLDNVVGTSLALDGAGDVFVGGYTSDFSSSIIAEIPAGGGSQISLPDTGDLDTSTSIATDGSGNLYFASSAGVVKDSPGATTGVIVPFPVGPGDSLSLAADGRGDVYTLAAGFPETVIERPADGGPFITIPDPEIGGRGLYNIAVDGMGDLLATEENGVVFEQAPGGVFPQILASFGTEYKVEADSVGNLFVTVADSNIVTKVDRGQSPRCRSHRSCKRSHQPECYGDQT